MAKRAIYWRWMMAGWVGGALSACDPGGGAAIEEEPSRGNGLPLERTVEGMDAEVLWDSIDASLNQLEGASPPDLQQALARLETPELWSMLQRLAEGETQAEEGRRVGVAVVILEALGKKDPEEVATYLVREGAPFGLLESSAGLLVFREAMAGWAREDLEAAWSEVEAIEARPDLRGVLESLVDMVGERLEVTLVGQMPLTDWEAVQRQWSRLERREVARLLPRYLARVETAERREALLEFTAGWLEDQWRQEGPGVVPEWALGLNDPALQQDVIGRLKEPERDEASPEP